MCLGGNCTEPVQDSSVESKNKYVLLLKNIVSENNVRHILLLSNSAFLYDHILSDMFSHKTNVSGK